MPTGIEWVQNPDGTKGETWPVVTGCTAESPACYRCYAARETATRLKNHPRYEGLAMWDSEKKRGIWSGEVRVNEDVLEWPVRWRKPRTVFVASMSDLFHNKVPRDFIKRVFNIMTVCRKHTFIVLTKRASQMFWFLEGLWGDSPVPDNIWGMVTVENQDYVSRIDWLLKCNFVVSGVSAEPMLGPLDLTDYLPPTCPIHLTRHNQRKQPANCLRPDLKYLSWVIGGGESGWGARPSHILWFRGLRDQCVEYEVPFFFKQWGEWAPTLDLTPPGMDSPSTRRTGTGWGDERVHHWDDGRVMVRVGRKEAGRRLDGKEWSQMPIRR